MLPVAWPSSETIAHVGVTLVTASGCSASVEHRGSPPAQQEVPPLALGVQHRGSLPARLLARLKVAVRWLVKLIYLFPLLLLAKGALLWIDHWAGDLITVAFVMLLVLFFSVFALVFVLYPLAGPPSRRTLWPALDLPRPERLEQALVKVGYQDVKPTSLDQLASLGQELGAQSELPLRVTGRIVGLRGQRPGEPVARQCWLERQQQVARLLALGVFGVQVEEQLLVLDPELGDASGLYLLGRSGPSVGPPLPPCKQLDRHDQWLRQQSEPGLSIDALAAADGCTLVVGDEIELVAGDHRAEHRLADLTLGGRPLELPPEVAAAPYRDGAHGGLVLSGDARRPLILRKL